MRALELGGLCSLFLVLAACGVGPRPPAAGAPSSGGADGYGAAGYPTVAASPGTAGTDALSSGAAVAMAGSPSTSTLSSKDRAASAGAGREPTPVAPMTRPARGGLLTAGVWDDARNFDFFSGYANKLRARGADFDIFATSELARAHERATSGRLEPRKVALALAQPKKRELDVTIVFDTTGSMGDELAFVQREFDSIAATLRDRLPTVRPRWSLVVYRDQGDQYVTRDFDFTTDTVRFRERLAAQSAGGGGDYPEAVVEGLKATAALDWRDGDEVAKVAFWVADAPTHPGEGQIFGDVVRGLAKRGVHLYPVAASGSDELTEFEMRNAALITGGRYMFLTDDSGVGNAHAEPHIPCYAVTRLDRAIVRMLEIEVKGEHVPTPKEEVVRAVGSPRPDGTCLLKNGDLVAAF